MTVSVSGYNYSGSGAVLDLLKEYEETNVLDKTEMPILDFPDGIRDLEYHINGGGSYFNGDRAIKRFEKFVNGNKKFNRISGGKTKTITRDYIEKLVVCRWNGRSSFDRTILTRFDYLIWMVLRVIEVASKKVLRINLRLLDRDMILVPYNKDFSEITRRYMELMIEAIGGVDDKINVLDQLLPAHNPRIGFQYLYKPKAIVVDRDPRDIYALCKCIHNETCFPTDDVKKFVDYHKSCWGTKEKRKEDIEYIQFEDLIFNYDQTIKKLEEFLQIKEHTHQKRFFNPDISVNNTQVYKKFPEIKEDIIFIEKYLSDYIYPFPEQGHKDTGKIF